MTQKKVQFLELNSLMSQHGLNASDLNRLTGVARQTLSNIMGGELVKPSTIAKILKGLREAGLDVTRSEDVLIGRQASDYLSSAATDLSLVPTVGGIRDAKRAVVDARQKAHILEASMVNLLMCIEAADFDVDEDDAWNLHRHLKKINLELQAVFRTLERAGIST